MNGRNDIIRPGQVKRQQKGALTSASEVMDWHIGKNQEEINKEGNGKVDDVKVNGVSVLSGKTANITVPTKVSDLENDADYATQQDVEDSVISEVEATIDNNVGTPDVDVNLANNKLTLAFQNILGDGIASIQQTTTSQESGGVNVVTVTTVGGKVGTFQIRNGEKGDTVILGEGVEYILYNGTGQNTGGAMTQKAVTDALNVITHDVSLVGKALTESEHYLPFEPGDINGSGNNASSDSRVRMVDYLPINGSPTFSFSPSVGGNWICRYYDENKEYLGSSYSSSAVYIRIVVASQSWYGLVTITIGNTTTVYATEKYKKTALQEQVVPLIANTDKLVSAVKTSALSYSETGILRTPANYYSQVCPLDTNKRYALAITTSVSGTMTVQAGTAESAGSMVDTIATVDFVANQEQFIYDYKPTGAYKYFRLSSANSYTLKLYEYIDGNLAQISIQSSNVLRDSLIDEYKIKGWCVVPIIGWMKRMLLGSTGEVDNVNTDNMNKSIHSDYFQLNGIADVILNEGYQARLYEYSNTKEFVSYSRIENTQRLTFDGTKYYRICLFHGSALTPSTAEDITVEECKNISLIKWNVNKIPNTYNTRNKIYGIKIDNSLAQSNVTRIADAVGLHNDYVIGNAFQLNNGTNDFDSIFPWCEMKLCNVKIVNGIKIVTYQGESGFTRDGTNGDVMVEIPKFYSMRIVNGSTEDILISGQKYSGFEVEPVFIDSNGKELNYVYCGVYLTHVENGTLTSKSGELPTTNLSLNQYRQCNGEMYDFAMLQCLQKLMSIEMCSLDIQSMLGGLSWLPYEDVKAYESATSVNSAYFYSNELVDQNYDHLYKVDYLYIGEGISITNNAGIVENRKITALGEVISYQEGNTNRHRRLVTFSGNPVNLTADTTLLTGHGQESGLSDALAYHTGRVGINEYATADQFKYRNIEGLWGNCGEYMDGIRVKNAEYYVTFDQSKYSNISNYAKLSYNAINCVDIVHKYNWKYIVIKQAGFDRRHPNVNLPISVTGYAAVLPIYYSCNVCVFNDIDYNEQSVADVEFVGISSLAWDAGRFNGLYTYRFWQREDNSQWLYSTRMIYRSE